MATVERDMRLLTVREVAERLNVSINTVYRRIYAGEIPAYRLGGKGTSLRIDPADVGAWLYGDDAA
jgi:excisionase family DNA binding protein